MLFNKRLIATFSMLLALTVCWGQEVIFAENFDEFTEVGGNDGQWKGNKISRKAIPSPFHQLTLDKAYPAHGCLKMGTGSTKGSLTLPKFSQSASNYVLTFRAGAWDATNENLNLIISAGDFTKTVTLSRGKFEEHKVDIPQSDATISISGEQDKNNRYFIDDLKVTIPASASTETVQEVHTIGQLRQLPAGTKVSLRLAKNNPAQVYATKGRAETYMADSTSAILVKDFLLSDRGWHPTAGGSIVGQIDGQYILDKGMPTLVATADSRGNTMLCLDHTGNYVPRKLTLAQLQDEKHRAQLVQLDGVEITKANNQYVVKADGTQLPLQSHLWAFESALSSASHCRYELVAVVGAADEKTVLYPTALHEQSTPISLDEAQDQRTLLQQHADQLADVQLTRVLKAGVWNSLSLPFDVESPSDFFSTPTEIAAFSRYDAATQTAHFTTANSIEAGKAYLVRPQDEITQLSAIGVRLVATPQSTTQGAVTWTGNFAPITPTADQQNLLFFNANQQLESSASGEDLWAYRGHFELNGAAIQRIAIDGQPLSPTAIGALRGHNNKANTRRYNLGGQRVNPTQTQPAGVTVDQQGHKHVQLPNAR